MKSVTSRHAKANLISLLRQVERGEEVLITRRGVPVARITQAFEKPSKDIAKSVERMLAYRDCVKRTLGTMSVRQMIEEGRRY